MVTPPSFFDSTDARSVPAPSSQEGVATPASAPAVARARGKVVIRTLGCKANGVDSQWMEEALHQHGFEPLEGEASTSVTADSSEEVRLCVVNSCTVTHEADRQSRKMASRLAKRYPQAQVVITGCGAEVDPEAYRQTPGVDYVIGNQDKHRFLELLEQEQIGSHILNPKKTTFGTILGAVESYSQILSKHPMDRLWPSAQEAFQSQPAVQVPGSTDRTRGFLKIQEGCNAFCTYCIIPYGRGPSRALELRQLIEQVQQLETQGTQEVIFTGTNIGDYPNLAAALKQVLANTSLPRIRLSSLDPAEITPEITELFAAHPRLCPHFHVSLQSASDPILRLMKRKYSTETLKECLGRISELPAPIGGVYVGMDVITGFPGETEDLFERSFALLESLPWSRLHVFPYSERKGTPATRLPHSVPPSIRSERAKKLNALSFGRIQSIYQHVLKTCQSQDTLLEEILTEKPSEKGGAWISGYTPNYLRVQFRRDEKPEPQQQVTRNQRVAGIPIDIMLDRQAQDVTFIAKRSPLSC